jgi:benzoate-CoA ligase family protein
MSAGPHDANQMNAAVYFVDRHVAEGRGARVAFECGEQRVTYAELSDRVNRTGNALRNVFGVRMEERVLLLLRDSPEFAYCFFGAIKIGAVPVPVNTLLKPHDYIYLLNDSRARVAIVSEHLLPVIEQVSRKFLPFLQHILVVGKAPEDKRALANLLAAQSAELEAAPTSKDDVAFWLYSSGSTGAPKGCIHLQHDMIVATDLYARGILRINENDRCFSVAKLFFAYGLGNGLYFPLAAGATSILLPESPSPKNVYAVIERHRPTLFFSVPSNYAALLDFHREGDDFDLSSVRLGISAGEALPARLVERFKARFDVEVLDGLGSTEALHIFISNRPGEVRPGSSGRVVPGCEVKLMDDDGLPVRTGEIGMLWVNSEAVCTGYWNQHDRTKATIHGHWTCTGDKYYQDEDGYFWCAGRSDDMLKVSGAWVSPAEIESVLVEHEAVAEAAVVGHRDKDDLVKPIAYIILRSGFWATPELGEELKEFVVARLPVYKRPRWVEFVTEFPKTATGKIQRFVLRERAGHGAV